MRVGLGHAVRGAEAGRPPEDGVAADGPERPAADPADALAARSLADALLGAAGLRGEARGKPARRSVSGDRASLERLSRAVRAVEGENYQVVNADVTVSAEGDDLDAMTADLRRALAERLHVAPGNVSLKRGPGPAVRADAEEPPGAVAVVLLDRIAPMDQVHSALRGGG